MAHLFPISRGLAPPSRSMPSAGAAGTRIMNWTPIERRSNTPTRASASASGTSRSARNVRARSRSVNL